MEVALLTDLHGGNFDWKSCIYCSSLLRNFLKSVHKDGDHTQDHDSIIEKVQILSLAGLTKYTLTIHSYTVLINTKKQKL